MRIVDSVSTEHKTDAELIAAVTRGDRNALADIVRRYEAVVASTVIGMLGAGDAAEEAGQVAMIKIYNGLDRFRADSSFKTYVTRIAMNTALDELRRRKRFLSRFFTRADSDAADPIDDIPASDNVAGNLEQRQLVLNALNQLKPEFRSVAVLRLMQGYSTAEVAAILNLSEGTVFSRLSRARQHLKAALESEIYDE
ncbi:MAG: RNA polymerase sigma factor [Pseudomonadota bacterium]